LIVIKIAKIQDNLPSSTTADCSIPFAITVSNLEFLSIQGSMHEPQTRLCGLLAIVLQIQILSKIDI
jgi:hypothetical protein